MITKVNVTCTYAESCCHWKVIEWLPEAKFIIYVFSSEEFYVGNFFPQNKICFAKMIDESITSQKVHNFINNEMNMLI